jgi:ribose transport system substrate-binding protein
MISGTNTRLVCAAAAAGLTMAACGSTAAPSSSGGSTTAAAKVGVDFPRSDSEFWNAFNKYVPLKATGLGINLLTPTNSQNNIQNLIANVQTLVGEGAKGVVMAPQDTAAIVGELSTLAGQNLPVVSVDTRPDSGKWYMVVRANNVAYGTTSCKFIGSKLNGQGNVAELEGDLTSINGRDRTTGFDQCMQQNYPNIKLYKAPAKWDGPTGAADLQTFLTQTHNNINGVYMQASTFLQPTINLLKQDNLLVGPSDPKHIVIVDNDGVSADLQAIGAGQIDAAVSQPADLYAQYALFYIQAAIQGKTFKAGPTNHNSTIVDVGGGNLEDQLAAPLATADGASGSWGPSVKYSDSSLWGNAGS